MKRYEFYRNQKITVIDCRYFSFEAENLETAVQKIKDLCADGQLDELSNDPTYQEDAAYQIPGTEYPLDIENNNGDPTVMIYSAADGNCIMDNLPKRSIKCLSMPARRVFLMPAQASSVLYAATPMTQSACHCHCRGYSFCKSNN